MSFERLQKTTHIIKQTALDLNFNFCGISKASYLEEEAPRLEKWLKEQKHGSMQYMENHFEKRLDPRKLVDGAKSVISLLYNYYTPESQHNTDAPKISKYAYGVDYHKVIKKKLSDFVYRLQESLGVFNARIFVDSAPVMDKVWAKKSGLGWIGKHSNLINKNSGSFFFIAEVICDIECVYDSPIKDYCGTCTRCIDACPTNAISEPYVVDGSKCISYFTIELKSEIPQTMKGKFENWMFGCDICQDVCPWNKFSKKHTEPLFEPKPELLGFTKKDWVELTEEIYKLLFKNTAVERAKYSGLKRNISFLMPDSNETLA